MFIRIFHKTRQKILCNFWVHFKLIFCFRTYEYVVNEIGASHYDNGNRDVYVITRTERPKVGRTIFYKENLTELVDRLKFESGKNIYCDGGAEIINELLKHDLIDELII